MLNVDNHMDFLDLRCKKGGRSPLFQFSVSLVYGTQRKLGFTGNAEYAASSISE